MLVPRSAAERRADFAGGCKQLSGLGANHREIFVFRGGRILGGSQLHHLAFGDDGGGTRQYLERAERADLHHHAKRLAEQEIADQHARLVAPEHACGELAAPHLALVNHIVVQERRGMHELDGRRELHVPIPVVTCEPRHRQREHRPQPFAPRCDQVIRDLRDHRNLRPGP